MFYTDDINIQEIKRRIVFIATFSRKVHLMNYIPYKKKLFSLCT